MGTQVGVIEGFFGPAWPEQDRRSYAPFIAATGGGFYIYAPKQDPFLRKRWREEWSREYLQELSARARHFQSHGVTFGVGLSPFGLGTELNSADQALLERKLQQLTAAGVRWLGLFFDDMPTNPNLAQSQIACVEVVRRAFAGKVIFCPSYYTPDPILDKVFGQRPAHYLEDIAAGIPREVSLAWTGPKVISPELPLTHVQEVGALLRRPPFIWENLYANDGPKNCKFLKLRPFSGRSAEVSNWIEAYGFNMMNQPQLSKVVYLSSRLVLKGTHAAEEALGAALEQLCSAALATFILKHRSAFLERGLDQLTEAEKGQLAKELAPFPEPIAAEISAWLGGEYVVGSECLTD